MRRSFLAGGRSAHLLTAIVGAMFVITLPLGSAQAQLPPCPDDPCTEANCSSIIAYPNGAATARMLPPDPYRAKDFAFIKFNGVYHLFYILHDRTICREEYPGNAITFGHSTSLDLENWSFQGTVLVAGPYPWDAFHIWAPTLVQKDVYLYMFFTGVDASGDATHQQRIGGARIRTDIHPDLHSGWTEFPAGSIDQPNPILTCGVEVPGCLCGPSVGPLAEVRDPFVMRDVQLRNGELTPGWLMYYVTRPQNLPGGYLAVNVAWARYDDPTRWTHLAQLRATHYSSHQWSQLVESPHLFLRGSTWYLFFTGDHGIEWISGPNPLGDLPNDWSGHNVLDTALGSSFDPFYPELWFASEYLKDGTHEYLAWVHDFNPPLNDPLCSTIGCQEIRPVEVREMLWTGATFTLADPSPVRTADWIESYTGHNCFCNLGLTILDAKNRTAEMVAVRILPDNSEQIYPMSAVGFPNSVYLSTLTSLNLHRRIQNPDLYNDFRFKVRITNQPKVIESDVIEIVGDVECVTGGGGGGPYEIPATLTPAAEAEMPKELALRVLGTGTSGQVTFRLELPSASHVKLELFDASGRRVRTLVDEQVEAGRAERQWDGRDDHAVDLGSGIYFARIHTAVGERRTRVLLQR